MTESLRALLNCLIDYAGLFPPAALSMAASIDNFKAYRAGEYGWTLNRLVLPRARSSFCLSLGSCSVSEPLDGLRALRLL